MTVRAKVFCKALEKGWAEGMVTVKFQPVQGNSEENNKFYAATPGGEFSMTLSKQAAAALAAFTLGKEYYVDFTPVSE
jgi:hypothetical protein